MKHRDESADELGDLGPVPLPEPGELPKLPQRVTVAYVVGVAACILLAAACFASSWGDPWAVVAGCAFVLLALSQVLAYMWRAEAWEAHTMAVALSRAVAWLYSDEHPEP